MAKDAIAEGEFRKVVPVIFEEAHGDLQQSFPAQLIPHLRSLPPDTYAYGYSYKGSGVIGASPELLFRSRAGRYETMAVAGTRPAALAEELLTDPKEQREHRMVVEDIAARLAPFGNVAIGPRTILRLSSIAHLMTPISFAETGGARMSFQEMIRRLHPTAALGAWPRTASGERWLREADAGVKRRTYGAPFGLEHEDRSGLAIVAIRNVQWRRDLLRIGSGAGLLAESVLEREIEELRQKREQVKGFFGLQ